MKMKRINNLSCEVSGMGDIGLLGEVTQFGGEFWAGLRPLMVRLLIITYGKMARSYPIN